MCNGSDADETCESWEGVRKTCIMLRNLDLLSSTCCDVYRVGYVCEQCEHYMNQIAVSYTGDAL